MDYILGNQPSVKIRPPIFSHTFFYRIYFDIQHRHATHKSLQEFSVPGK